jgi:leucyl/phenylalanyl-tRNA---protein transferase
MRAHIPRLGDDPNSPFPDPKPNGPAEGLIAWGGDLSVPRLLNAYRQGIFPWFEPGSPILWWNPDPRPVFEPRRLRLTQRLRRELRQGRFQITLDRAFAEVMAACAGPRVGQRGTWITQDMHQAYLALHRAGHAHSLEVWDEVGQTLIGGIYGVAIGKVFFAESKFHRRTNASKIALAALLRCLEQWHFLLLDCQIPNPHLERLGARLVSRDDFGELLRAGTPRPDLIGSWRDRLAEVDLSQW